MKRVVRACRRVAALASAPLIALAVLASAAQADCKEIRWQIRWQPDLSGATGGSLIRVPVCIGGTPDATPPRRRSEPREPTRSQLRALRFQRSEAVSARVRERMIAQLAHGEQAEQIRAEIGSGHLMRQFDASIRRKGWSTHDTGDMYTQAYVQLWFLANARHTISSRAERAVREDLRSQLALDRGIGRADDATQQELAEWLGSWTVVLVGGWNQLRTLGDPARIQAFRDYARELIDAPDLLDVDLTQIRLSRRGVERR